MEKEKTVPSEQLAEAESAPVESKEASSGNGKFGVKQILPIVFIVISIVWIVMGLSKFGFYDKMKGGTAAFLPVVCSVVMLLASTVALIQSFKDVKKLGKVDPLCLVYFAMCFGIVVLSQVIGLMLSMTIYVFIWLRFIEKCSWKSTIIITLSCAAVGYGLFELALGVPFDKGFIYNLIFRR